MRQRTVAEARSKLKLRPDLLGLESVSITEGKALRQSARLRAPTFAAVARAQPVAKRFKRRRTLALGHVEERVVGAAWIGTQMEIVTVFLSRRIPS
jgi:hypothetical protein